ncbi:MAG: hypothetical protein WDN09_00660 [bacterium]
MKRHIKPWISKHAPQLTFMVMVIFTTAIAVIISLYAVVGKPLWWPPFAWLGPSAWIAFGLTNRIAEAEIKAPKFEIILVVIGIFLLVALYLPVKALNGISHYGSAVFWVFIAFCTIVYTVQEWRKFGQGY